MCSAASNRTYNKHRFQIYWGLFFSYYKRSWRKWLPAWVCNWKQVWLKSACCYESQYPRGRCWCKGKWFIFCCWPPGRWETHVTKPISASQWRQRFFFFFFYIRKERGTGQRDQGWGVEKFSIWRLAQSILIRQVMVQCASSWLYVILSAWLKVSKSTRARMPEGQSLYHLKLIPRILTQTCCWSTGHILVRVCTYTNNVRRMVRWIKIPYHYNFPLLQVQLFTYTRLYLSVQQSLAC